MSGYSQLFPPRSWWWVGRDAVRALATWQFNDPQPGAGGDSPRTDGVPLVPAGYTYFGQFLGHDLSFDASTGEPARAGGGSSVNHRTARLDLDCLYGTGPKTQPHFYALDRRKNFPHLLATDPREGGRDLPRLGLLAVIPDPRNDENLVTAQLHSVFAAAHNRRVGELVDLLDKPHTKWLRFQQVRREITWHYQYLVRHDFLPKVAGAAGIEAIARGWEGAARSSAPSSIPLEFALAGFRFGHAMVRNAYNLNKAHESASLREILRQTGRGGRGPIDPEWFIDWTRFFHFADQAGRYRNDPDSLNASRRINPYLAAGLREPELDNDLFVDTPNDERTLAYRTLSRGLAANLASGQDVASKLGVDVIPGDELASGPEREVLKAHRLHEQTPLWYYVLKEAELRGEHGRLGEVGTFLVTSVLIDMLVNDEDSYIRRQPTWQPFLRRPPRAPGERAGASAETTVDVASDGVPAGAQRGVEQASYTLADFIDYALDGNV